MSIFNVFVAIIIMMADVAHGLPRERVKRSDDVSLTSLQSMIQQQATVIQALEAKVTALESVKTDVTNLQASVNKLNHQAMAVGFTAHFHSDPVNVGTHGILKLDTAITNIGNGYNSQTGIFTAPVAGLYALSLIAMSENSHSDSSSLVIDKHGTVLDTVWLLTGTDVHDYQGSSLVTTHLAAGEKVWVRHNSGSTIVRGGPWTVFSGYLVQAD